MLSDESFPASDQDGIAFACGETHGSNGRGCGSDGPQSRTEGALHHRTTVAFRYRTAHSRCVTGFLWEGKMSRLKLGLRFVRYGCALSDSRAGFHGGGVTWGFLPKGNYLVRRLFCCIVSHIGSSIRQQSWAGDSFLCRTFVTSFVYGSLGPFIPFLFLHWTHSLFVHSCARSSRTRMSAQLYSAVSSLCLA